MLIKIAGLLFLYALAAPVTAVEPYKLKVSAIAIYPVQKNDFEKYSGKGPTFELSFFTPNQKTPLEAFPEPPFTLRNLTTGRSCKGGENGGIWEKKSVYATENGKVLLLGSFSGSSNALEFYDVKTCKQIYWLADFMDTDSLLASEKTNEKTIVFAKGLPTSLRKYVRASSH